MLGEGESFFVEHVAAARFLLLQRMVPHATTCVCVCVHMHKNLGGSMLGKDWSLKCRVYLYVNLHVREQHYFTQCLRTAVSHIIDGDLFTLIEFESCNITVKRIIV